MTAFPDLLRCSTVDCAIGRVLSPRATEIPVDYYHGLSRIITDTIATLARPQTAFCVSNESKRGRALPLGNIFVPKAFRCIDHCLSRRWSNPAAVIGVCRDWH
jgi:hypothetical protein